MNFINSSLPVTDRYYFSKSTKTWGPPPYITPLGSPKPKTEGPKSPKASDTWAQVLIQFINLNLEQTLKEENVPVKLEVLEIEFPQKSTNGSDEAKVSVIPWFEGNQVRATLEAKLPTFSVRIAAAKGPITAKARIWNLDASGTIALGFEPPAIEPAWFSFMEAPIISFKCDVENIPVSQILKRVIDKVIKDLFLHPKRFFIETGKSAVVS